MNFETEGGKIVSRNIEKLTFDSEAVYLKDSCSISRGHFSTCAPMAQLFIAGSGGKSTARLHGCQPS